MRLVLLCGLFIIIGAAGDKKKPLSQIDVDYLSPEQPEKHSKRQKCSGLGQTDPLKGLWVGPTSFFALC